MKYSPQKIALIVWPFAGDTVHAQLGKFIHILEGITEKVYLIAGVFPEADTYSKKVIIRDLKIRMHAMESIKPRWRSVLLWAYRYVVVQIKMTVQLFGIRKDVETVIFHYGIHYPVTMILAKLMGKKVINMFFCPTKANGVYRKPSPIYYLNNILDWIVTSLSDRLVVGTEGSIDRFGMEQYRRKLVCSLKHWYIDDVFQINKPWDLRRYLFGYVGRFRADKGVIEVVKAIPLVLATNKDAKFLMVGDGLLMPDMKKIIEQNNCSHAVDFTGYVNYDQIPALFNDMKFHVLASIAEVSGAVNMEAMACGTVAIANAVGGVPDIITDGENGFLLPNNLPETIAAKIHEVEHYQGIKTVIRNAKEYVNSTFVKEAGMTAWQEILYKW